VLAACSITQAYSQITVEDDGSPYVAPGEYTVKMKYGDFKAQTKLTVEAPPGVHEGEFVAP